MRLNRRIRKGEMRSCSYVRWLGLVALLPWAIPEAKADLATIFLRNGEAQTVELVAADRGQIQWKTSVNAPDIRVTLRSQVNYVLFPTTEAWRSAEEAFESGNLRQAVQGYQRVINDKQSHYYPFPGNFVSLAQERLLRCFRLQMDPAAIAKQAEVVRGEFSNLPPEFRTVDPAVAAWTALSKGKWEEVLTTLEDVKAPGPEVFFLRGRALEELGRHPEAVQEYAGVYVLNFGGSVALTQAALKRSSALMASLNDKDRQAELKAQLKIYRDLFGKGKLWEGASEELVALANGEIETIGSASGNMEKPESAGGAVIGESASVASLPPPDQRDYLLVGEIEQRVFVVGPDEGTSEAGPNLAGGVKELEYGYAFDGTGGGIRIGKVDGSPPVFLFRVQFNPAETDGIVVDLNEGTTGGCGLYLRKGEIVLGWSPKGGGKKEYVIGKAEKATLQSVLVHAWKDGTMMINVNGERQELQVPAGGLKLGKSLVAAIGYGGNGNRTERGTAIKIETVPFKGTVQHFSVGSGGSLVEIEEREVERFGKRVALVPPQPADGGAEEAPAAPDKNSPAPEEGTPAAPEQSKSDKGGAAKGNAKGDAKE